MQVVSILVLWTGIEWKWVTGSSAILILWPGTNFDPIGIVNLGLKSEDFWEGVFNPLDRSPPLNRPLTPPQPCRNCVPGSWCLDVRSGDNPKQTSLNKTPPKRGRQKGRQAGCQVWPHKNCMKLDCFYVGFFRNGINFFPRIQLNCPQPLNRPFNGLNRDSLYVHAYGIMKNFVVRTL